MKKLSIFLIFALVLAAPLMAVTLEINNPIASAKSAMDVNEFPPRPPVASKPLSEETPVGGQIFPIITEAHEVAQVFPFDSEVQSVIPGNPTYPTKAAVVPFGGKINFGTIA